MARAILAAVAAFAISAAPALAEPGGKLPGTTAGPVNQPADITTGQAAAPKNPAVPLNPTQAPDKSAAAASGAVDMSTSAAGAPESSANGALSSPTKKPSKHRHGAMGNSETTSKPDAESR